jgi:hypothetical protein
MVVNCNGSVNLYSFIIFVKCMDFKKYDHISWIMKVDYYMSKLMSSSHESWIYDIKF